VIHTSRLQLEAGEWIDVFPRWSKIQA